MGHIQNFILDHEKNSLLKKKLENNGEKTKQFTPFVFRSLKIIYKLINMNRFFKKL